MDIEDNHFSGDQQINDQILSDVDIEGVPNTIPNEIEDNKDGESAAQAVGPDGLPIEEFQEEPSQEEAPPLRVRRFATIMNILNSLLGAGILSVPHSFVYCGIVPSLIILSIIAILSHVGTVMTMKLAMRQECDSLADLAEKILGKPGSISILICSMLFCVSCMVGYLIICSGTIASWFSIGGIDVTNTLWKKAILITVYGLVFPMAFTVPRDIGFLAPFSMMTFGCICFFILAICIKAGQNLPYKGEDKPEIVIAKGDMGLFSAISIYGLAFALPVIILPIIKPYNPDMRKRSIISFWSTFLCFVCVVLPGILGYLIYGDGTENIILDNFSNKDPLMICVRVGFFIVVSFSYPCIGQSLLTAWSSIIWKESNQGGLPFKKRIVVLVVTNIIPLLLAILLPNAGPALSIGGAFGGCMVDFFYPALMWIKISKKPISHWQNLLCILFAIFGIVSAAIATYQAIVDCINAFKV